MFYVVSQKRRLQNRVIYIVWEASEAEFVGQTKDFFKETLKTDKIDPGGPEIDPGGLSRVAPRGSETYFLYQFWDSF